MKNYEKLETKKGLINAARDSYRILKSIVRAGNLAGASMGMELFPEEYDTKPLLESSLLQNSILYANRETGEKNHIQNGSRILEIGVGGGAHASSLIQNFNPSKFHGVDINFDRLKDEHKSILEAQVREGKAQLHIADSAAFLTHMIEQKEMYDFIYIDANHWHKFVKEDLELSTKLIGIGGRIVLNDYLTWFVRSMEPCGVIKATNNFLCNNKNWKVEYFAINDRDICLKRIN